MTTTLKTQTASTSTFSRNGNIKVNGQCVGLWVGDVITFVVDGRSYKVIPPFDRTVAKNWLKARIETHGLSYFVAKFGTPALMA